MSRIDTCRNRLIDRFRKVGYPRARLITDRTDFVTDLLHGYDCRIDQGRNLGDAIGKIAVELKACRRCCQDRCRQQSHLVGQPGNLTACLLDALGRSFLDALMLRQLI